MSRFAVGDQVQYTKKYLTSCAWNVDAPLKGEVIGVQTTCVGVPEVRVKWMFVADFHRDGQIWNTLEENLEPFQVTHE